MKINVKSLLTFLVGWPLSFLALFFIVKTFLPKTDQIAANISSLNSWLLILGILCFLTYYILRSIVWHDITKEQGYKLPFRTTSFLWATSEFKRYIPGNVWSFLGRTFLFAEQGMHKRDVAKGLIIEMEIVLLGCLFSSLLSLPFLAKHFFTVLQGIPNLKGTAILCVIVILLLYMYAEKIVAVFPTRVQQLLRHILPVFSPYKRLYLVFLSTISFFFFGLGYYFSIAAITFLHPQEVFVLSGFFVFSLLVGLLSFITPTGLGVREGAITFGLSQIIPLSFAGFASIFGRILLVISETLFLFISYSLTKMKNKKIERVFHFIEIHKEVSVLSLLIGAFIIYFSVISILRHDNFYTGRFDLGNMDQTVWNTIHGKIFQFTNPDGTETVSRLAFHADFLLILLAPFYLIWEDPRMLLLIQATVVGLGALFVYALSKDITKHKGIALALSFAYLLNPSIQRATIYDFHAVTLATTFLLGAFYFMYKKRYGWFVVFAVLSAITKEQIWFIIALLGLFLVIRNNFEYRNSKSETNSKHKRNVKNILKFDIRASIFGFSVFIISLGMFYYLIWHAIPAAANSDEHFALSYFSDETAGPSDLVKNVFRYPEETWEKITEKSRKVYYKQLLLPLGYLPLGAPWVFIFPAADITLNVLSDKPELHQMYYQYTAAISPFLFIGAIYCLYYLSRLFPRIPKRVFVGYILITALYGAYLYSPLPGTKEPNLSMLIGQQKDTAYIKEALAAIDPRYSVAASNNLGAHLTHRERIYTIPRGVDEADVVVFHLGGSWNQPSNTWHKEKAETLRNNPEYALWFEKGEFIVFKKIVKKESAGL